MFTKKQNKTKKIDIINLEKNGEETLNSVRTALRRRAYQIDREQHLALNGSTVTFLGFFQKEDGFPMATFELQNGEWLMLLASTFQPFKVFKSTPKEGATQKELEKLISTDKKTQGFRSKDEIIAEIMNGEGTLAEKREKSLLAPELSVLEVLEVNKTYKIKTELFTLAVGEWEKKKYAKKRVLFSFEEV
jgi:hypothetical protein